MKNLRKLRLEKGISQQQLAKEVWVTQQSINKYENHNIEPDVETLIKLADYFNTSVDYLIGHTEVDHIIEHVEQYDLNDDEAALINHYRKLSVNQRNAVSTVIRSYND
ncbi:MAG: helix-turn-helix transcriptional regulator [Ruminococcus sp.]|nr:helix-turn-helix transcriptional regulator [Ruminococcus sp.]